MADHEETAEQKIILATIDRIEKEGLSNITIRGIAEKAGVNIAAVNYYFRSKDNLINLVLKTTADHMFGDLTEILERKGISQREALKELCLYLIEGSNRFPQITRAQILEPFISNKDSNYFIQRFKEYFPGFIDLCVHSEPEKNKKDLYPVFVSFLSAVMFPAFMPFLFSGIESLDFKDADTINTYVERLLDLYIPIFNGV